MYSRSLLFRIKHIYEDYWNHYEIRRVSISTAMSRRTFSDADISTSGVRSVRGTGDTPPWHPLAPGTRATSRNELGYQTTQEVYDSGLTSGMHLTKEGFGQSGVGHDLWGPIIPNEHGLGSVQRPMNCLSYCTLR